MQQIISASRIDDWFVGKSRRAQETLPHLIRNLVRETVPPTRLRELWIPAKDQIGLPGYDGRVLIEGTHPYVPEGLSVWEMGTNTDPRKKANRDLRDRTNDPGSVDISEACFVFVTPHEWNRNGLDKQAWVQKKESDTDWKSIIVLDFVAIEEWLEDGPVTARWLARKMGISVDNMQDTEGYRKEEITSRYGCQLPTELLIGGRTEAAGKLKEWLRSGGPEIRIAGESGEEANAFVVGVLDELSDESEANISQRTAFISDPDALEYLTPLRSSHIVVAMTSAVRRRAASLNESKLRMVIPQARSAGRGRSDEGVLRLGPVKRAACERALSEMNMPDQEVHRIGREFKGSFMAALWMATAESDEGLPWTTGGAARNLVPLLIAGQWEADNDQDREMIERLSGAEYEQVKQTLAEWETPAGPLVPRGPIWDWLAWDYAWDCLARYIDSDSVDAFLSAVKEVLGTPDPSLELPPEDRWAASLYEKKHPYSSALRTGLAGSIVQLALHSEEIRGQNGQSVTNNLVETLLSGKEFPRRQTWLSVARWLPDLAEAAPNPFLEAVDNFVDDEDAVAAIFEEGGVFGHSPHTYLLWSLERLAWSQDYLTRVTLQLGGLAAIDPGGQLANRPSKSLTEIYLPWHPQTMADRDHRLKAIDVLYEHHDQVAWNLLLSLMPGEKRFAGGTAEPQWRQWKHPGRSERVSDAPYWQFIDCIVDRLTEWANLSGTRMADLVGAFYKLRISQAPPARVRPLSEQILRQIELTSSKSLNDKDRIEVSEALRDVLSKNRQVEEENWALNDEEMCHLHNLYESFLPEDLFDKHRWLFDSWPELPDVPEIDYEEHEKRLRERRQNAIREVYEAFGIDRIITFAKEVERPDEVGSAMVSVGLDLNDEAYLLTETLGTEWMSDSAPSQLLLGVGYVKEAYQERGQEWVSQVMQLVDWDAATLAHFALGLPTTGETWDWLEEQHDNAAEIYWRKVTIRRLDEAERDAERAVDNLLRSDRFYASVSVIGFCIHMSEKEEGTGVDSVPVSSDAVVAALDEAPKHDPAQERFGGQSMGLMSHHVERILDLLEERDVGVDTLARLEWIWMGMLERGQRGLKALQRKLSEDPAQFIDLLKLLFRAENEDPSETSEIEEAITKQAFRLLRAWNTVPGTISKEPAEDEFEGDISFRSGEIDEAQLFDWVETARQMAKQCGRLKVCDSQIGKILAHAPVGEDGAWPCVPVRKLIEKIKSPKMEEGIRNGVLNKRGVHWRGYGEGGEQERRLASKFQEYVKQTRTKWVRTTFVLKELMETFERQAQAEDQRAKMREYE